MAEVALDDSTIKTVTKRGLNQMTGVAEDQLKKYREKASVSFREIASNTDGGGKRRAQ
jgi:hypothetical protein